MDAPISIYSGAGGYSGSGVLTTSGGVVGAGASVGVGPQLAKIKLARSINPTIDILAFIAFSPFLFFRIEIAI
jgi:hypothetical protein